MRFFADVSHFQNIHEYLPILIGVLNAELTLFALVFYNWLRLPHAKGWYRKFNLNAILFDSCVLFITLLATRFVYSLMFSRFHLVLFMMVAVVVQILHDFLFYLFLLSVPKGFNRITDYMKKYSKEEGVYALVIDAALIAFAVLLSSHFAAYSLNIQIILLILTLYFVPYMLYMG